MQQGKAASAEKHGQVGQLREDVGACEAWVPAQGGVSASPDVVFVLCRLFFSPHNSRKM